MNIMSLLSDIWSSFGRILAVLVKPQGWSMTGILITIGIVLAAAGLGIASTYYMGDDNPVEEYAEKIIEGQTGVDLDLSPSSPEKK